MHNAVAGRWLSYTTLALMLMISVSNICAKTRKVEKGDKNLSGWEESGQLNDDIEFRDNGLTLFIDSDVSDVTLAGEIKVKSNRNPSTMTIESTSDFTGTVSLTANNSYQGNIILRGGTVQLAGSGKLGSSENFSGAIDLGSGTDTGTFKQNSTADQTLSGVISGTGSLVKDNSGTLTLTGSNTYTGTTTVNDGTLRMVNSSAGDAIFAATAAQQSYVVGSGATLEFSRSLVDGAEDGTKTIKKFNLSGAGTFKKAGDAELRAFSNSTINMSSGALFHVESGIFTVGGNNNAADWSGNLSDLQVESGASIDGAGGAMRVNSLNGAGTVLINGGITVGADNGSGSFSGAVVDSALGSADTYNLTKEGSGTQTLSGANTYSGDTTISSGTLEIGGAGSLGSGSYAGAIANSGTFKQNSTADQTLSGVISGTGSLVKDNSGTLTLTGSNTYAGDTTISGGTLEISGAGSLGSGTYAGAIANSGTFKQNSTADQTLSGVISGTGSLVKDNSGTLTLTGSNTYAGDTTVNAGTLRMVNSAAGNGIRKAPNEEGTVVIYNYNVASGATLEFEQNGPEMYNINRVNLSGGGTFKKTGSQELKSFGGVSVVAMDSGALFHVESGTFTFGANVAGNWSGNRSGLQVDTGATFDGAGTAIVVDALNGGGMVNTGGGLNVGIDNGSGSFSGVIANSEKGSAHTLTKSGSGTQTLSGANTFSGDTTISGGTLEISGAGSLGSGTYAGAIANSGTFKQNSTVDQTLSGVISGTGALVKDNTGTLTLTGDNTYSGGTTLNAGVGTLVITGVTSAGTGAIVQADANSILRFDTTGTITNNMTLYNFESLRNVTLSGDINSQDATYKIATGKDTILSGNITGTGKLSQIGADDANYRGTLTLSGDNDFDGDTEVDSVLNVGSSGALSENSKLKVNNGGMVKLNGFDSTVAGLEGNGTIQGSAALTAGDENDAIFSGILQDGDGAEGLSLMKKGSGKMTLSGANTFSGNTTLDEGSLEVKNAQALGTGSLSQTDDSSSLIFDTTGTVTNDLSIFSVEFLQDVILSGNIIANNATYNVADGVTVEALGDVTGTGGTTKLGLGTQVLSGNNTYTGANDVQAGTLRAGSTTAFGDNVATTVDSGAVLELDGFSNSIGSLAGAGTVENASATAATLTTGADNTSTTFSGVLQDGTGGEALSLTKTGAGTQTLTGANTYSGGTTIDGGTLSLGSGASQDALGSGAVTVNSGGSLKLWINPGGSYTIDNAITLDGGRVYSQDGQYNLTGAMTLNAGGGTLGGTWQNKYLQVSGVISGTGGLTVEDSDNGSQVADVILSGVNTYTGNTVIGNNVVLQITGAGKLGSGSYAGTISNTGTLEYNSSANQTLSGVISGTGALIKDNTSTLTLRGTVANTYSGGTTINGGTVSLGTGGGVTSHQDALGTGSVSVNSGGELRLWISNTGSYTIDNAFTLDGGTVHGEDGLYDLTGAMTLAAGGGTLSGKWSGKGITVSGTISGTGALTIDEKAGGNGGEVTLTANNNFSGGTIVDGGTLQLTGSGRIGSGGVTVNNGGTLSVATNAFNSLGGAITINQGGTLSTDSTGQNAHNIGAVALNGGTLTSSGNTYSEGNWIFNGDVTVGGSALSTISGSAVGSKEGGGTFNVADSVAGSGTDLLVTANMVDATGGSSLTKTGAGTMTLSGTNTYTGTTTINQGTLELATSGLTFGSTVIIDGATDGTATMRLTGSGGGANNMLSDAAVTIQNGGTLDDATTDANVQSMGTITFNNGGTMSSTDVSPNGTFGNYFIKGGVIVTGNAAATINATELSLNGTQTFNVADATGDASSDLTISSEINEFGGGSLTKTGAGTLTMTAKNTYTGGTTVNDGTLNLDGGEKTLQQFGTLTVNGASSLVQLGPTVGGNNIINNMVVNIQNGGTVDDTTTSGFVHSMGVTTFTNGGTLSSTGTGYNATYGNYLFNGNIEVTGNAAATIDADAISLSGGVSRLITVADVTSDANTDLTISSIIKDWTSSSYINKEGAGTMELTGANTYTGDTTLSAGTLVLGNASAAGTGTITQTDGTSTLRLNTTGTIANNISLYNLESLQSVTLSGSITANNATYDIASGTTTEISGAITGTGGTTKEGLGTLLLSGDNTYTGNTEINAGTLSLSSSTSNNNINDSVSIIVGSDGTFDVSAITASGGFQLANGQTLAGTGDVNGATQMTAGSNLSAGDSGVGTLSFLSSLDVANASTGSLLFDLGSAGTGDLIDVTGQLSIGDGQLDLDSFAFTNLGATSVTGTYTWDLFQVGSFDFTNLGSNTTDNIFGSYSATLAISGGNVVQLTMFVPEPSSTALLGLGGLMLALRRKR